MAAILPSLSQEPKNFRRISVEKVMVMAEDERVRENRLALLTAISRLFGRLADFARLSP